MKDFLTAIVDDAKSGSVTAKADVKSILTSRFNDVVMAVIVLGAIWVGHLL